MRLSLWANDMAIGRTALHPALASFWGSSDNRSSSGSAVFAAEAIIVKHMRSRRVNLGAAPKLALVLTSVNPLGTG